MMDKAEYRKMAADLIEPMIPLFRSILIKHSAACLEEMHDFVKRGRIPNIELAAEYVHHLTNCKSPGGLGDHHCTCGAVDFLDAILERSK